MRPSYLPGELRARHSHTALGPTEAADWTAPPGATQGGGSSDATLNRGLGTAGQLGYGERGRDPRVGTALDSGTPAEDADVEAPGREWSPRGVSVTQRGAPRGRRGGGGLLWAPQQRGSLEGSS
ncbi:unnamed protein product [Arctogadus glacialis]